MRAVSDSIKGSWDEIIYSNLLEHWYGLVPYAKKILSLARVSYLVNGVKSLQH